MVMQTTTPMQTTTTPPLSTDLEPLPLGALVAGFARRVWAGHRGLALLTLGALGLLAASLILQVADARTVLGAPAWMKPAKFAASIALLAPVLAWILGQMPGPRRRRLRAAGTLMTAVGALELVIISVQAARGVPSHFNNATTLDATLFQVMGGAITLFWLAQGYVALRAFRQAFATPARTWGIRLGLAGALLGGAVGFVMPRPTPAQLETLRAGGRPATLGAHAVGVPDGGPGLPVTRWSVEGGDLRVPHFFGLHALQGLPLVAFLVERRRRRGAGTRPVIAAGVAWIGFTVVTLWQGLRGQPLVAPDGATLAALALVAVAAAAVAFAGEGARHAHVKSCS